MTSLLSVEVRAAVEGRLDEAVVRRLIEHCGGQSGRVLVQGGRGNVLKNLAGYNAGARYGRLWLVLVDLDQSPGCAPELVAQELPSPASGMCFRIAVHEAEAWLLADAAGFANWAGIGRSLIPPEPESIAHPKERLIDIVRQSRHGERRVAIVPDPGSGMTEGPAYTSVLSEFVREHWDIEAAAANAPSLARAIRCLRDKIASPPTPGQ